MPSPHPHPEHKTAHQLLFNHYLRTGERLTGQAAQAFLERKAEFVPDRPAEQKSAEGVLFEHYLRTGQRLHGEVAQRFVEQKFNPNHDPDDGRFTFGPGGGSLPPRTGPSGSTRMGSLRNPVAPNKPAAKPGPVPAPPPWARTHPGERLPVWRPRDRSTERGLPANWRYRAGKGDQMGREEVERRADNAQNQFYYNWGRGMSIEEAAAWAANSEDESRSDHQTNQDGGGPGRGLFQWEKRGRAREFEKRFKIPIEESTRDQQHSFREWELANPENPAKLRIDAAQGADAKAAAISVHYLRPADESGAATDRANIAEAIMRRVRQSR